MEVQLSKHYTPTELTKAERIDASIIRRLSILKPWISVSHIILEYVFIISAIVLCSNYWHPLTYIVSVMWIGARQHALIILMHEGAHYRIVNNRKLNDFLGEVFTAFPVFITMQNYRLNHLPHHRHMNTEKDPDWVRKDTPDWKFPKSRSELFFMLFKIALGFNVLEMLKLIASVIRPNSAKQKKSNSNRWLFAGQIVFYSLLIATLIYFGWWLEYLLYWIIPMFTWLQLIFRIRSIAEHFGVEYDHTYTHARNTYPSIFDRLFLASKNVWYHLDHHLYPSVPFYHLPQLHEELNELELYKTRAHNTKSYLGVLKECSDSLATNHAG